MNNGVWEIYNAGNLYWFAQQVNAGSYALNGRLMADIVIPGGMNWTPMGGESIAYTGTFDGNGHTVSGMLCQGSRHSGFFGNVGTGGTSGDCRLQRKRLR